MNTTWIQAAAPDYDYLEINSAKQEMHYDSELKTRTQFWSQLWDEIYQQKRPLSEKAPVTLSQSLERLKLKNEEL